MKTTIALLMILSSVSLFAQDNGEEKKDKEIQIKETTINVDSRGDMLTGTDVTRLQERVKLGFTIDAMGLVEIVGLVTTGSSFNNDWATVLSNGSTDKVQLAFRNIYLRKTVGQYSVEAGALTPNTTIGSAGLAPTGWMDGVRVKANTKIGDFKVTAGSLGSFKEPNAFSRKFEGNFLELEFDKKVFEEILTQTALEVYNGDIYLRENLKIDLKVFGDKVFKVFADALYDFERQAMNYELGTEIDILKNMINKYENRLNLKVYYSNINSNIPGRSEQVSAFYTYGPRVTTQVGGKLDKQGNINWYARASLGQTNRYDVGLNIKIPSKKKK